MRALATQPRLLLLDEPAGGMNLKETEELDELIRRIRERGITVMLVEHDMSLVMEHLRTHHRAPISARKIAEGKPSEIKRTRR